MKSAFVVLIMCLAGCVVRQLDQDSSVSKLLDFPQEPELIAGENSKKTKQEKHGEEPIVLFSAPNQGGNPQRQHWNEELGIDKIAMDIISEWDDGSKYHLAIRFTNPTDEAVNANLNLYAYDRMGRLVRTEFGGSINFRSRSVLTKEYRFSKRGREVRWIFSLTGKK